MILRHIASLSGVPAHPTRKASVYLCPSNAAFSLPNRDTHLRAIEECRTSPCEGTGGKRWISARLAKSS